MIRGATRKELAVSCEWIKAARLSCNSGYHSSHAKTQRWQRRKEEQIRLDFASLPPLRLCVKLLAEKTRFCPLVSQKPLSVGNDSKGTFQMKTLYLVIVMIAV